MNSVKFTCMLLLLSALGSSQTLPVDKCVPLSTDTKQRVENYLSQRLVAGTGVKPSIKSADTVGDSCYRKVTMTIPGTTGEVSMFLSPDERFLTSSLYDLSSDPQKEVARIADEVTKLLMRDDSPRLAGSDGRVTLVEFVDFQCPYCKRLADWYSALPDSLQRQTTVVFKNLPLPQHPWARPAAEYAVCASRQSSSAFHQLTAFLFRNQPDITAQNLKDKLLAGLGQSDPINLPQLATCASGSEASQIVERDVAVAKQLSVSNTPTLFIDGRRVLRVASAEELQQLLETELANTASTKAQANQFSAVR